MGDYDDWDQWKPSSTPKDSSRKETPKPPIIPLNPVIEDEDEYLQQFKYAAAAFLIIYCVYQIIIWFSNPSDPKPPRGPRRTWSYSQGPKTTSNFNYREPSSSQYQHSDPLPVRRSRRQQLQETYYTRIASVNKGSPSPNSPGSLLNLNREVSFQIPQTNSVTFSPTSQGMVKVSTRNNDSGRFHSFGTSTDLDSLEPDTGVVRYPSNAPYRTSFGLPPSPFSHNPEFPNDDRNMEVIFSKEHSQYRNNNDNRRAINSFNFNGFQSYSATPSRQPTASGDMNSYSAKPTIPKNNDNRSLIANQPTLYPVVFSSSTNLFPQSRASTNGRSPAEAFHGNLGVRPGQTSLMNTWPSSETDFRTFYYNPRR